MNAPRERLLQVGHGHFDLLTGELCLDGRTTRLRPRTAAMLAYLVERADQVVTKEELMEALWPDVVVTEDSIVQCVREIRHALGETSREWIRTLPRTGYAFVGNGEPRADAAPAPATQLSPSAVAAPEAGLLLQEGSSPSRRRRMAVAGAFLAAGVLAGVLTWQFWPARAQAPPSIIVMPISNATGDAVHERTADDLTEAITDTFTRGRGGVIALSTARTFKDKPVDVRALAEQLRVRYVVQGALMLDEEQYVVRLRLAEADNALQLWQQDFRINPGLPELRPEFASGILTAVAEQLLRAEARRSGRPESQAASDLIGRAIDLWRGMGRDETSNARFIALLEQALKLNDDIGPAWAMLSGAYMWDIRFTHARDERLARAAHAIERARQIVPANDSVIAWQGNVYYEQGRVAEALKLSERAIEVNPANALAMLVRARAFLGLGRPEESLRQVEQALRKSPKDPLMAALQGLAGLAHLHRGDVTSAVEVLRIAVRTDPNEPTLRLLCAGALGAAGRVEEARAELAELEKMRPGYTLSRFRAAEASKEPEFQRQRERLYEGLRRAGLPE